tara:strand:+ start:27617 stop:28237 length:621 start_codon:yes stop_codon:yes gene_type:complete
MAKKKSTKKKVVKKKTSKKVAKKVTKKKSGSAVAKKSTKKKSVSKKTTKAAGVSQVGDSVAGMAKVYESTSGPLKLSAVDAEYIVLYFYPKDSTPGCTNEGIDFTKANAKFKRLNAQIVGVSRDSMKSHEKFSGKYNFNFPLISDPEETLCNSFGVIQKKKLYGREFMGVVRSTFILNKKGKVLAAWEKVKVPGHVKEVLEALKGI